MMIKVTNLTKSFGENVVLNSINLEIKEGEMVALTGKSGAGKSTLLNIIGLLDSDFTGELYIKNTDTKSLPAKGRNKFIREELNYLFQNYALVDDETVYDNIQMAQKYKTLSKKEKKQEVENVLKEVGLEGKGNQKIFTLSGGEQQRVALARSIIKPGSILLADEPTGNLDNTNTSLILDILKSYNKKGKTVIVVTHSDLVANECQRIINLG